MGNLELAQKVLNTLNQMGVKNICLCAGARNSPFVELLADDGGFETLSFFDERSAGFFALGRIKRDKTPVAVITTSGTAAGELLPAMMEGYYSGLPLIAVTADRPKHFRGSGAPQAAEQVGLYGQYAFASVDIDKNFKSEFDFSNVHPLHVNICFDEPLPGEPCAKSAESFLFKTVNKASVNLEQANVLNDFLDSNKNIFAIIGGLTLIESKSVAKFLKNSNIPFYAEAQSQLRTAGSLSRQRFFDLTKLFVRAENNNYTINAVLRIGDVPTHRLWRDLEKQKDKPVLSISSKPFSGLPAGQLIYTRLESFMSEAEVDAVAGTDYQDFKKEDFNRQIKINDLLQKHLWSEPGIFRLISEAAPQDGHVYLGNSLPIRQWDLAATVQEKGLIMGATRGLNGIDGQVSYFLGGVVQSANSWAILGDLTTLYDMQGLWAAEKINNTRLKIFIINNGGGKIFERIFGKKAYYNAHRLNFENLAKLWNLSYQKIETNKFKLDSSNIVEICPDEEATKKFWEEYQSL